MSAEIEIEFSLNLPVPPVRSRRHNSSEELLGFGGMRDELSPSEIRDAREDQMAEYYDFFQQLTREAASIDAPFSYHFEEPVRVRREQNEGRNVSYWDGGPDLPSIVSGLFAAGSAALAIAFLKGSKDIIVQWLKGRTQRSVRLTYKGKKVEIKGTDDIDKAMTALREVTELSKKNAPPPSASKIKRGVKKKTARKKTARKKTAKKKAVRAKK